MMQIQKKEVFSLKMASLFPNQKKSKFCWKFSTNIFIKDHEYFYFCEDCQRTTSWKDNTTLRSMQINVDALWALLNLFVQKKTSNDAYNDMNSYLVGFSISEKSVKRYFKIFSKIAYQYYREMHEITVLEGEIEIDETQLYRMKRSHAPGRPYTFHNIWLIGFRERGSKRFLIFPTESRNTDIFLPLLLNHAKPYSTIYTDCFSVYVNNANLLPESKLQQHGYIHKYVNHKIMFVNSLFPEIHTNTVERLWKSVKEHIKKH